MERQVAIVCRSRSRFPGSDWLNAVVPKIVDHVVRRREVALAAARVIVRRGIDGVTVREIAREGGLLDGVGRPLLPVQGRRPDRRARRVDGRHAGSDAGAGRAPSGHQARPRARGGADAHRPAPCPREPDLDHLLGAGHPERQAPPGVPPQRAAPDRAPGGGPAPGRRGRGALAHRRGPRGERLLALADGIAQQALFDTRMWRAERQLAAIDEHLECLRARGETLDRHRRSTEAPPSPAVRQRRNRAAAPAGALTSVSR